MECDDEMEVASDMKPISPNEEVDKDESIQDKVTIINITTDTISITSLDSDSEENQLGNGSTCSSTPTVRNDCGEPTSQAEKESKADTDSSSQQSEAPEQGNTVTCTTINDLDQTPAVISEKASSPTVTSPQVAVNVVQFDFWAPNNYKRTVKRVDEGAKLCDDMMKLVSERAEIEGLYATKLQGWSRKWNDLISKGSEYATLKTSWQNMASEAEQVAQIHVDLQQKMLNQVYNSVSTWKTSNYHKSILSWKETKNAEEGFSKAQKPWAKKYDGVTKCKKAYYTACRARDLAEKQIEGMSWRDVENVATQEQLNKAKDKAKRASNEVDKTYTKYKESIRDISNYNPKYRDDMCFVFNNLQEFEERRKTFMKQTLEDYCKLIELSQYFDRFANIYSSMASSFQSVDVASDLSWWSQNLGTGTPVQWPEFEEYHATQEEQTGVVTQHQTAVTQHQTEDPQSTTDVQPKGSPQAKKSSVCTTL